METFFTQLQLFGRKIVKFCAESDGDCNRAMNVLNRIFEQIRVIEYGRYNIQFHITKAMGFLFIIL